MTAPKLILVKPQLAENIGATARAMANFGLENLRMVAPRIKLPDETARRMSAGAEYILDNAEIFETTKEAIADLNFVYATTARPRDMVKAVLSPEFAMKEIRQILLGTWDWGLGISVIPAKAGISIPSTADVEAEIPASGASPCAGMTEKEQPPIPNPQPPIPQKVGILFGPERTGLENEDIVMADRIISIPTTPDFSSLNIAQSVVVVAYEWLKSEGKHKDFEEDFGRSVPATMEETNAFFEHLETELANSNFFKSPDKRTGMMANLRNTLQRARFSDQDIRTIRGVIRALVHKY